ncbi:MAG: phosphatase PAP2 family protein [Verrucomicrobiaceae bacterium]|nr:phosphatase PAP2 family protein [Verrucomicrobiaceae bacterium]
MRSARILLGIASLLSVSVSRADVITDWNALMRQTFAAEASSATPPVNSRTMGMMGGAMFDAVNSVNRNYNSYLGYFDPATSGIGIDMDAAAATAAYQVMTSIYTDLYGAGNSHQSNFTNLYNSHMAAIADGTDKTRGIEVGAAAAAAMIAARASDGWNATPTYSPQPLGSVGRWQPGSTPGAWGASTGTFLKSHWGNVTPFTLNSSSQFRPDGPTGLNGTTPADYAAWVQSASYTAEFNQVKNYGGNSSSLRTADQTVIAYFWVDGPGTASPPGHWNRIAQSISASAGLNIEENARLFALLNLAEADVGIATWEAKVFYDTWRPMIAINTADTDGNPDTLVDAAWTPLIPTPSFGAYTSGHSAFSMAAATILAEFFGTDDIAFTTDSESPFLPAGYTRSYSSFSQAAEEAGLSRIYGGIHWQSDNEDGALLGESVANYTFNNFLLPVPEPAGVLLLGSAMLWMGSRRRKTVA